MMRAAGCVPGRRTVSALCKSSAVRRIGENGYSPVAFIQNISSLIACSEISVIKSGHVPAVCRAVTIMASWITTVVSGMAIILVIRK